MRWIPSLLLIGGPLAVISALTAFAASPDTLPTAIRQGGEGLVAPEVQGVSSCSAVSCHGGAGKVGAEGCEQRTWAANDKHAQAYRVLFNERSKIMLRNYRALKSLDDARPQNDAECLLCHAPDGYAALKGHGSPNASAADGVSCESCHGPAERWLSTHYLDEWKTIDPKTRSEKYGFVHTKDLTLRVQECAKCHVGRDGQEVNHDLIAAGHPRLRFEFTAYQRSMPPHWREKNYGPDFEVRAWAIGQVANARAAVELLRSRAERAKDNKAPWPEFAEYSCYSCHHDLKNRGYRQDIPGHAPGELRWGTWYGPMLDTLAKIPPDLSPAGQYPLTEKLRSLYDLMRDSPKASPRVVAEKASAAVAELDVWLRQLQSATERDSRTHPVSGKRARDFLTAVVGKTADAKNVAGWEWEQATQHQLAAEILYRGSVSLDPSLRNAQVENGLREARKFLRFPADTDGPSRTFSTKALSDQFSAIEQALRQKDGNR